MYISEWKMEEEGYYYQAELSLKKDFTPFLKLRIIFLDDKKEYNLLIRDCNSGLLLYSKNIAMEQREDGVYSNLNSAKKTIKQMTSMYLTSVVKFDHTDA